jgi:hypothetical protein
MPQITIQFDCSDQSFQFSPDPLPVPYNSNETITWKLVPIKIPTNGTVTFPATGGVTFGSDWPGSQPTRDPNDPRKYTVDDDNDSASTEGDFKYTTKIAYFDGLTSTTPTFDPDVENEGPPPMVSRKKT